MKESPLGFRSYKFAHLWQIHPALWNLFVLFMLFLLSKLQKSLGFKEDQMRKNETEVEEVLALHEQSFCDEFL
jgi:hypothetical protein